MKNEYAIVNPDGTFQLDHGYYGNSPAILLYTKDGGKGHIATYGPKGAKLKKVKV